MEELLGEPLPPSAREYEQWWRGGRVKRGRIDANWQDQVQQRAWEDIGWTVEELDLMLKNVTFRRRVTLRAITFDFWSTLVDGAITPERTARGSARLHAAIVGAGHACSTQELEAAFGRALDARHRGGRGSRSTTSGRRAAGPILAEELGIPDGLIPYEVVEHAYEDITLDPLPDAMPHVHTAVDAMTDARLSARRDLQHGHGRRARPARGAATPRAARLLRRDRVLERIRHAPSRTRASSSTPWRALGGVAPREALHVGDLEELDVEGARRAGMHSALYAPEVGRQVSTRADLVVTDWRNFGEQLAALRPADARQPTRGAED